MEGSCQSLTVRESDIYTLVSCKISHATSYCTIERVSISIFLKQKFMTHIEAKVPTLERYKDLVNECIINEERVNNNLQGLVQTTFKWDEWMDT